VLRRSKTGGSWVSTQNLLSTHFLFTVWGAREVPSLIAIYRVMEIVKIRGDGSGERWGISYQAFLVTADLLEYAQNLRYTTAKCSHIFWSQNQQSLHILHHAPFLPLSLGVDVSWTWSSGCRRAQRVEMAYDGLLTDTNVLASVCALNMRITSWYLKFWGGGFCN